MRSIGHVTVNFHAAIHRSGMKDEQVARRGLEPCPRDTKHTVVFTQGWDVSTLHPFQLQAQNVQRIGPLDGFFDTIEHRHTHLPHGVGEQRSRTAHAHFRTEFVQPGDV